MRIFISLLLVSFFAVYGWGIKPEVVRSAHASLAEQQDDLWGDTTPKGKESTQLDPVDVDKLIQLLPSENQQVREEAFNSLMDAKPWTPLMAEAISSYSTQYMNERGKLKIASYLVGAKMGKYSVKNLINLLASDNGGVRAKAAKLLGAIGAEAAEAIPALEVVSKNDARKIEKVAKHALRKITLSTMVNSE